MIGGFCCWTSLLLNGWTSWKFVILPVKIKFGVTCPDEQVIRFPYTLGPVEHEFGYNKHSTITSRFLCTILINSNLKKVRLQRAPTYREQFLSQCKFVLDGWFLMKWHWWAKISKTEVYVLLIALSRQEWPLRVCEYPTRLCKSGVIEWPLFNLLCQQLNSSYPFRAW